MRGVAKYDWVALKAEFLVSHDKTVAQFCRRKELPIPKDNAYIAQRTTGWSKEKEEVRSKALEKYAEEVSEEMLADTKAIRLKQAKYARDISEKAMNYLLSQASNIKSVEEARRLLETGVKIESQALGLSEKLGKDQKLTQINLYMSKFGNILEDADEEELTRILSTIRGARREHSIGSGEPTSTETGSEIRGED